MPNVTLKDIALKAQVSLATLDRVLNKRGASREATVERIERAIHELGYRPNLQASQLARGTTKKIAVILPEANVDFLDLLSETVEKLSSGEAHVMGADLTLSRLNIDNPITMAENLRRIGADCNAMILLCSFDPAIVAVISELEEDGVRVASIVSDIPGSARTMFAGPNNMVVGRVGGDLIAHSMRHQSGMIAVISPESHQEDHASRLAGFTQVLLANNIARERIRIIRYGEFEMQGQTIDQFLAQELSKIDNLDAIYLTGGGTKATSRAVSTLRDPHPLFVANDLTPTSRRLLIEQKVDFIVSSTQGEEIRAALSGLSRAMSEPFYAPKDFESQIHVFTRHNLPTRSS